MTTAHSLGRRLRLAYRLAPALVVPVLLAASAFPGEFRPTPAYWVLSCCAAGVFVAGRRWPMLTSLLLSTLAVPLFAAEAWGLSGLVPYLGALAVADLAARTDDNRTIAAAATCWASAFLIGNSLDRHTTLWSTATVVTMVATVTVPVLLGLYLRGQRQLAASYRLRAHEAESRRAAEVSATRSQERTAMARELHDLVAHHMAAMVLRVNVAEHVMADADPRVSAVLSDVRSTATDALADIRRLQDALRGPAVTAITMIEPDAAWTEIEAAVTRTRAAGFTIDTRIGGPTIELDSIARLTMLRVTQEALTNVMKHADAASPVELAIHRRDGGVAIRVSNERAAGQPLHSDRHGIIGMTERIELIGGHLEAGSIGSRWVLDVWLPTSADKEVQKSW